MRRLALFLALVAFPAAAQSITVYGPGVSNGSFSGEGDIVSGATAWYGSRAYSAAVAATGLSQSVYALRRASDNATCTATLVASGAGLLDVSVGTPCSGQTVTAWIGASSALVSTAYDQSGSGHNAVQATAAQQPTLVLSAVNSLPCMESTAGTQYFSAINNGLTAQPTFLSATVKLITGSGAYSAILQPGNGAGGGVSFETDNNNALIGIYAGTFLTKAMSLNAAHAVQALANGATLSAINVDGSDSTGNAGTTAPSATSGLLAANNATNPMTGYICEAGSWATAPSATTRGLLHANQSAYWGTP